MMGPQRPEVFVGRRDELDVVQRCAVDVERGRPWVLVISGTAGAGKSSLVRRALGRLGGFGVVTARADALATDRWMWVVGQLTDVPSGESAFGVGLALLGTLAERQSTGPVALVVEDLHWADDGSRRALLTALRRLDGDRVLAMVTTRPDERIDDEAWRRLIDDGDRCQLVELGPLTAGDVSAMADELDVPLGPNAAVRLQRHTDGHALHVRTLLRELSTAELNAFGSLPAPRSLAQVTVARLAQLPAESAELVRALAVLARPARLAVLGAVAGVADPTAALEGALASGLIEWEPTAPGALVRFVHPMYAAAVYGDITPIRRRQLHLAASGVDVPAALTHRIAAADRADPALAAELDEAAAATSDPALAARYLSAAADLSGSPADAEVRLLAAGRRHLLVGDVHALGQLRARLEDCRAGAERAVLLGWLAWQTGDTERAEALLRGAAGWAGDDGQTAEALLQLGSMYAFQSRGREAIEVGRTVLGLGGLAPGDEERAWRLVAGGVSQAEGGVAGIAVLDDRYGRGDPDRLAPDVTWAYAVYEDSAGRPNAALVWFDRLMSAAPHGEISRHLPHMHMIRAMCHYRVGAWDDALVHANAAIDLANDEAQTWILAQVNAVAAWLHAGRGDWELARRRMDHARTAAAETPIAGGAILTMVADGFVARAADRPADVVDALSPLTAIDGPVAAASNLGYWPALVHALVDLGRVERAGDELARLRVEADARRLDVGMWVHTLEARLLAAAGDATAACEAFEAAVGAIGAESDFVERIVLRHRYGRHLRAMGRRREAIAQLVAAHDLATGAGAAPYAERIDLDLRGSEARVAPAGDDPLGTLTARERDVVTLIAGGATNREAAGSLYVSVKAVEYHLGNVYAKLHVTSRRQLKAVIGAR